MRTFIRLWLRSRSQPPRPRRPPASPRRRSGRRHLARRPGAARRLPGGRDRLRPGADLRPLLAHHHRRTSSRPVPLRPAGAAAEDQAADGAGTARGVGRLPHLDHPHPARHLLRRRPGLQGPAPRARRAGLRLRDQALRRPGTEEPRVGRRAGSALHGLAALRQRALDAKQPFDYEAPVEGLRALDRYTLQIQVDEPRPRLLDSLVGATSSAAIAREVVEFYGDRISEHPVGTGPFKLGALAAQLADRAGAQPGLPRAALRRRSRPPTTPRARRWPPASRVGACRCSTGSRSRSSRSSSRAGWRS